MRRRNSLEYVQIDLRSGLAKAVAGKPRGFEAAHYTEADLDALLTVCPAYFGLPPIDAVGKNGGTTETVPDKLYLDELGRVHVVELKNETAGVEAVAQVLAYGEHYRLAPRSEMIRLGSSSPKEATVGGALTVLRSWAASKASQAVTSAPRLAKPRTRLPPGMSPHMVLLAPAFDESAVRLVSSLAERCVSIELLAVAFAASENSTIVAEVKPVVRNPLIEWIWRVLGEVWQSAAVRQRFDVLGFADHGSYDSFSLSLRDDARIRLWLEAGDDGGKPDGFWLATGCPDHYGTPKMRKDLREILVKAVPDGELINGRWVYWSANEEDPDALRELAATLACLIQRTFAPNGVPLVGSQA